MGLGRRHESSALQRIVLGVGLAAVMMIIWSQNGGLDCIDLGGAGNSTGRGGNSIRKHHVNNSGFTWRRISPAVTVP